AASRTHLQPFSDELTHGPVSRATAVPSNIRARSFSAPLFSCLLDQPRAQHSCPTPCTINNQPPLGQTKKKNTSVQLVVSPIQERGVTRAPPPSYIGAPDKEHTGMTDFDPLLLEPPLNLKRFLVIRSYDSTTRTPPPSSQQQRCNDDPTYSSTNSRPPTTIQDC
ncbi:unnamed protein product, partial [Ectocarpus sp. 8 AP-2014]